MKKFKFIVVAILRGALILAPGVVYLWWLWGKVTALVAILAAVGLETLWAIAFSFVVLTVQAWCKQHTVIETDNELPEE